MNNSYNERSMKIIDLKKTILEDNDADADRLREREGVGLATATP